MCADFLRLGEELKVLESCGIEYLHVDVMDGVFVPNYTLGTDFVKKVRAATSIPLDLYLMISEPEGKPDWFDFGEGDYVSVHVEACRHLQRVLASIRARGAKAMVALNPATPLSVLDEVLPDVDGVLVMTVNPGFAGQKLIPQTLDKIRRLRALLDQRGYGHVEIECDGNVSFDNARLMSDAGANIFVGGTSSVYHRDASTEENINKLRIAIQ
jgi:ribulose-phosphate 3-epimerase